MLILSYDSIKEKIQAPFPPGTVQVKDNNKKAYIPAQVYWNRLDEVAGPMVNWSIKSVNIAESHVIVIGTLHIAEVSRDGIGYNSFKEEHLIKAAISSAESEAFRNACDKYKMGWIDLAPYRTWSDNPGINIENKTPNIQSDSERKCVKCRKILDREDNFFLELHNIRQDYCSEHVPPYLIKNNGG